MRILRPMLVAALPTLVAAAPCASQDDVLPITAARVTQLLQGLAAERPMWARIEAMEDSADAASRPGQVNEERRAKHQAWESCGEKVATPMPPDVQKHAMRVNQKIMALDEAHRTALMRQADELSALADDAGKRGDAQGVELTRGALRKMIAQVTGIPEAELQAGDAKMQAWSDANDARIEKSCGPEPEAPEDEEAVARRARDTRGEGFLDAIDRLGAEAGGSGARASGLTQRQYAILRERVVAWLAAEGDASRFNAYKFTDAELAALASRRAELSRYAATLARTPSWNFD